VNGALLLDKALGVSSNRALQEVKKLYGARKAGHAGTLDPLATGLLVVLFGEATKFAGALLDDDKEYVATLRLGEATRTGDAEGEVIERGPAEVAGDAIEAALALFRGDIDQVPPMHSALKRDGVPLYALARRGRTVERAGRRVRIAELECTAYRAPLLELRVRCSKGTYVRTLAEDIGRTLGTCAHLAALRRTASGRFSVREAATLEALAAMPAAGRAARLLPLGALLERWPREELDAAEAARFRNGQALRRRRPEGLCAVYGPGDAVLGLARADPDGALRPVRLVAPQAAD